MRFSKVFAVLPVSAALLLAGLVPGFPGAARAESAAGSRPVSPKISFQKQGNSTPAQSLDELLGHPAPTHGAKASTPISAWVLSKDTVVDVNTFVDSNEKIYLGGHTLTIYGDLSIYGALDINGGKLILKKSTTDTKNTTGNLIIKGGLLIMQKSADYVETAKSLIADGVNETGSLSAGTVKVNGQFLQLSDYSAYSYNETGSHTTTFSGANKLAIFTTPINSGILNLVMLAGTTFTASDMDVPVVLTYPGSSGVMQQPYTYHTTGGTFLSLKKNLTANYSITVPNLYYMGTQGAWSLGVSGNLIIPQGATMNVTGSIVANKVYAEGILNMAAGKTLSASQFFSIEDSGSLNLSTGSIVTPSFMDTHGGITAADATSSTVTVSKYSSTGMTISGLTVNFSGDLGGRNLTMSGSVAIPSGLSLTIGGGTVNVSGSINAAGTLSVSAGSIAAGAFYATKGGIAAVAGPGTNVTISKFSPAYLSIGGAPKDSTVLKTSETLSGDIGARNLTLMNSNSSAPNTLAIPAGAVLTVGGGLTVSPGQTLAVGAGRLLISGAMDVKGLLDMQNAAGFTLVGGTFTAEGGNTWGHLMNGTLALKGDFVQKGTLSLGAPSAKSFCPAAAHRTILIGGSSQHVTFDSPADPGDLSDGANIDGSWFGALVDCNQAALLPVTYYTVSKTDSSTKLSGITASAGIESPMVYPAFSSDTLNYEIAVPTGANSVTLSCTLIEPNQTVVTIVDGTTLPGNDGNNVIPMDPAKTRTVTLQVFSSVGLPYAGAGETFYTTYTVLLQPQNADLSSPGLSYSMDRSFSADTLDYTVSVPAGDESFTFTPALAAQNASFKFSCRGTLTAGPSFTAEIAPGDENDVEVDVAVSAYTNPNVSVPLTKTYRFTFHRQSLLDGIDVSSGGNPINISPLFNRSVYAYSAKVPASVVAVTISPKKGDGCTVCKINNVTLDSIVLSPPIESSATATIQLTDSTGTYSKTYSLTVKRGPLLTGISVSADSGNGSVATKLAFSSNTHAYLLDVPIGTTSISVSADKQDDAYSLAIDGNNPDVTPGDQKDVTLTASAGPDPSQQATYTVTIRMPLLSGLKLSSGAALKAPFSPDPGVMSQVTIPYTIPSVTLLPQGNDIGSGSVTFKYVDHDNGDAPLPGATVALSQGQARHIDIKAGYHGTIITYHVLISRDKSKDANLKSLGVSTGWLSPAFSAAIDTYSLIIPETVAKVTLAPAGEADNSTYKIGSLAANTPCTVTLTLNGTATVAIKVTAQAGNTKTYTVTLRRLPMLQSFSAKPVYAGYPSLSPGGTNRMAISYTLSQPASVKIEVKKGSKWVSILSRAETSPGAKSFSWDGKVGGVALASGTYSLRITPYYAGAAGTAKTLSVKILRKPSVSITALSPSTFTANGTNRLKAVVKWTRLTDVRVDILNSAGSVVKTLYTASGKPPASAALYWDGKNSSGALVAAGKYRIKVTCGGASAVYRTFTLKR